MTAIEKSIARNRARQAIADNTRDLQIAGIDWPVKLPIALIYIAGAIQLLTIVIGA